jgi:hypothetical protein
MYIFTSLLVLYSRQNRCILIAIISSLLEYYREGCSKVGYCILTNYLKLAFDAEVLSVGLTVSVWLMWADIKGVFMLPISLSDISLLINSESFISLRLLSFTITSRLLCFDGGRFLGNSLVLFVNSILFLRSFNFLWDFNGLISRLVAFIFCNFGYRRWNYYATNLSIRCLRWFIDRSWPSFFVRIDLMMLVYIFPLFSTSLLVDIGAVGCLMVEVRWSLLIFRRVDIIGVNLFCVFSGFLPQPLLYSNILSFSHEMNWESCMGRDSNIPSIDCLLSLRFLRNYCVSSRLNVSLSVRLSGRWVTWESGTK